MGALSFGTSQAAIGLDIGTDHVRVAQVKQSGSGFVLTGYGRVDVPMGAVAEGEIVDVQAVSAAIKELWRRSNVRGKDVSTGVSNQRVIVRSTGEVIVPMSAHDDLFDAEDFSPEVLPIEPKLSVVSTDDALVVRDQRGGQDLSHAYRGLSRTVAEGFATVRTHRDDPAQGALF